MIQNKNSEILEDSAMSFENGGVDGMCWPEMDDCNIEMWMSFLNDLESAGLSGMGNLCLRWVCRSEDRSVGWIWADCEKNLVVPEEAHHRASMCLHLSFALTATPSKVKIKFTTLVTFTYRSKGGKRSYKTSTETAA
jgi:hypothetical protein